MWPCLVLLILCLVNLGHGLFKDEYLTWRAISMSTRELVRDRLACGHLPTYFLALKGWCGWFGDGEASMRVPGLIFAVGAFPLFVLLARDLFGRRVAAIGGAVFAAHQLVIWCAQTARPYSGILFFSLLCALCVARWFSTGKAAWLIATAAAVAGGFSFHALFGLTVVAFVPPFLLTLRTDRRKSLGVLAALLVPTLCMTLPLLALTGRQGNYAAPHVAFVSPLKVFKPLGRVAFGDPGYWTDSGAPAYAAAALLVWLSVAVWRRLGRMPGRRAEPTLFPRRAFLFSWAFTPVVLLAVGQGLFRKSILAHERYFITALGGILLIVAAGMACVASSDTPTPGTPAPRNRAWRLFTRVMVFVMLLPCTVGWLTQRGDGPKLVASAMASLHPATVVAGYTEALDYEFRRNPPRTSVSLIEMSADDARRKLENLGLKEPIWLFVYDNKDDNPLIELFKKPPSGFRATHRMKQLDARAALMVPAGR
jgi:hypothetical protein